MPGPIYCLGGYRLLLVKVVELVYEYCVCALKLLVLYVLVVVKRVEVELEVGLEVLVLLSLNSFSVLSSLCSFVQPISFLLEKRKEVEGRERPKLYFNVTLCLGVSVYKPLKPIERKAEIRECREKRKEKRGRERPATTVCEVSSLINWTVLKCRGGLLNLELYTLEVRSTHSYRSDQGEGGLMVWNSRVRHRFDLGHSSEFVTGVTVCHVQSDPDLVTPDLVTPRFSDRINFPRYRKLTVFDPDLVATPICPKPFPPEDVTKSGSDCIIVDCACENDDLEFAILSAGWQGA
eukprot:sb/3479489/